MTAWCPHVAVSDNGGYNQLLISPATYQVIGWRVISNGVNPRRQGRAPFPPSGALVVSTAFTRVAEVAAPGDT